MNILHSSVLALVLVVLIPLARADIGQKGREKHDGMHEAVLEHRQEKSEAKAKAEAKGEVYVEKCKDLVIKKGKRTIVLECGDPGRNNPDCPVCGVNAKKESR